MQVEPLIEGKIKQIIRYFETGRVNGTDYSCVSLYHDGPDRRLQVTYGAYQTTEYGNLGSLIRMYIENKGKYSSSFMPYIHGIGNKNAISLANRPDFVEALKLAAKDIIMQKTQEDFFNAYYYYPALNWFNKNKFTLPLSLLVIFDSYVHSGGILTFLRDIFSEAPPNNGGNEKRWVNCYVDARDKWLEDNTSKLLRKTDYRTDSFIYAIRLDNWNLDKPFMVVNYERNDEKDIPTVQATIR